MDTGVMVEEVVYANAKPKRSLPEPLQRERTDTPKQEGRGFWNSPYTFGLLLMACIFLLCISVWLMVQAKNSEEQRLETQHDLTQMQEHYNQTVECLRTAILDAGQCCECPPGWTLVNQICYFLSTDKKTNEESERFCAENGSVLAAVRSKDSILKCHMQSQNTVYWVGLHQRVTWTGDVALTQWIWSDNTTELSLVNTPSTQCAKMGETLELSPCTDLLPWICERKPDKPDLLNKANAC